MLDEILSIVAPHYCCGCDRVGSLLCDNCKYNIINEAKNDCLLCKTPTLGMNICKSCSLDYERAWYVGDRVGVLQRLIGLYKFERTKSAHKNLAGLMLDVLPELPQNTIIVPVPTAASHIRERGYDHMALIAKHISKTSGLECKKLIVRLSDTKQRQASSIKRKSQASKAFEVRSRLDPSVPYLIIDDVMTTGSTLKYASKALIDAGAKHVWVAVIARQTLD